jgi:hypothetical protein
MADALSYYGVTKAVVLKYLPQLQTSGSAIPDIDEIDASAPGEFLGRAAADVMGALNKGGFDVPTCTSSSNVIAYWLLHGAIAERAALDLSTAIKSNMDPEAMDSAWGRSNKLLKTWESGGSLGELESSTGPQVARFVHGDDTTDDLDYQRRAFNREL